MGVLSNSVLSLSFLFFSFFSFLYFSFHCFFDSFLCEMKAEGKNRNYEETFFFQSFVLKGAIGSVFVCLFLLFCLFGLVFVFYF